MVDTKSVIFNYSYYFMRHTFFKQIVEYPLFPPIRDLWKEMVTHPCFYMFFYPVFVINN